MNPRLRDAIGALALTLVLVAGVAFIVLNTTRPPA